MNVIEVKNISFSYDRESDAVKGVSFSVKKGSYTCIIGHNGSGKSTIAKLIAGLLLAKEGEIFIQNQRWSEGTVEELRQLVGIVFQNPDNQFIGSSVREDIAFGLENRKIPGEKMDEIIHHYAVLLDVVDFLDREPEKLSGGQKQRVALAGVLAMQPEILLLDEATSMLDPRGKEEVKVMIQKLHSQFPMMTIISITHDIEEAALADEVVVMNRGKILTTGSPDEVFIKAEELRSVGLDVPLHYYIKNLFAKSGIHLHAKDEKEMAEELWQLVSKK